MLNSKIELFMPSKLIVPFLLGLLLVSFSTQPIPEKKDSRDYLNLKGPVKSIRQTKYALGPDSSLVFKGSNMRRIGNAFLSSYSEDFLMDNSLVTFTEDGTIDQWIEYPEKTVQDTFYFQYQENLKLPLLIRDKERGHTVFTIQYTYTNNRKVQTTYSGSRHTIQSIHEYKENTICRDIFVYGKDSTYMKYTPIDDQRVISEFITGDQDIMRRDTMVFNEQENLVKMGRREFSYEYDSLGNWIQRKIFFGENLQDVYKREIEYY